MSENRSRLAAVTWASSGIGAATARALAGAGFEVALGARRVADSLMIGTAAPIADMPDATKATADDAGAPAIAGGSPIAVCSHCIVYP